MHSIRRFGLVAITAVWLLNGCAIDVDHGTRVTKEQANGFTVGTSTMADVVKALGKPYRTSELPDGHTMIGYMYSHSRINPPSPATLTGMAPASEVVDHSATFFIFDAASKLVSVIGPETPGPKPQ